MDFNINNPGNEVARYIRASICIGYFAEHLIEGDLAHVFEENDDIMVVLVNSFITAVHFCPEKYQKENEHILSMLPQFEKAFPGLTQAVNGDI
jgi:hypothetical protein